MKDLKHAVIALLIGLGILALCSGCASTVNHNNVPKHKLTPVERCVKNGGTLVYERIMRTGPPKSVSCVYL